MDTEIKPETDGAGNIIVKQITGWTFWTVPGMIVILGIQYAESHQDLEADRMKQVQLALMPQQALKLSEALRRTAEKAIHPAPDETRH
jgi:hypothetical protein